MEVISASCVRGQGMFRIFQDARRTFVAGYIKVTIVVLLDEATRFLVHEQYLFKTKFEGMSVEKFYYCYY